MIANKEVEVGTQVGIVLDMATGNYEPVFKEAPSEVVPASKVAKVKSPAKKVAKVAKKAPKKVVRAETGVKDHRHAEILQVLAVLPELYKRGDFMDKSKEVLGYRIPFNKKVREVYSVKVGSSYKRADSVA